MKLLFFDDFRLGVLHGDAVVDVSDVVKDIPNLEPQDLISGLIQRFDEYKRSGRQRQLADSVLEGRKELEILRVWRRNSGLHLPRV